MKIIYTLTEIENMRHLPLEMEARTTIIHRVCGALAVLFGGSYPVKLPESGLASKGYLLIWRIARFVMWVVIISALLSYVFDIRIIIY